jgi:sugar O-acyltransferase (sialic acid O-acetyltransferase NeuD family)
MKKSLIGNGGHAREVMAQMDIELFRFVSDEYWKEGDNKLLPLSKFNPDEYIVMVAIANSKDREDVVRILPEKTQYFTFIHPTAQIMSDDVIIGEGSFIGANSIITCNIKLGKHSLLNRGVHVGHDSIIGNYFSAMPGSVVSGNVTIGSKVYLGTNSSIREKITICDDVVIGLNTGIVKNIDSAGTYIGQNTRKINN